MNSAVMNTVGRTIRLRREGTRGWWIIFQGIGTDGTIFEDVCTDRRTPIADRAEAARLAGFVASHFTNEDGTNVEIVEAQ